MLTMILKVNNSCKSPMYGLSIAGVTYLTISISGHMARSHMPDICSAQVKKFYSSNGPSLNLCATVAESFSGRLDQDFTRRYSRLHLTGLRIYTEIDKLAATSTTPNSQPSRKVLGHIPRMPQASRFLRFLIGLKEATFSVKLLLLERLRCLGIL